MACLARPVAAATARTLSWSGRAHVEVGGRSLDLVSQTLLTLPLRRVRSTSWIATQGRSAARTLVIEPDDAWVDMDGDRKPLPTAVAAHERQQYAIYTWLYTVQRQPHRPGRLPLGAPPLPDIVFTIGPDGFPVAASLTVDAPEPGKPRIAEQVAFAGRLESRGVRWPARIDIRQDDRPYFSLTIDRFEARA